jgi:hypothetical protein
MLNMLSPRGLSWLVASACENQFGAKRFLSARAGSKLGGFTTATIQDKPVVLC